MEHAETAHMVLIPAAPQHTVHALVKITEAAQTQLPSVTLVMQMFLFSLVSCGVVCFAVLHPHTRQMEPQPPGTYDGICQMFRVDISFHMIAPMVLMCSQASA